MDKTDEMIIDLLQGNARMSYQDLGDAIGMSRVAAKKRVLKLEREGIIRGYNTYICRPNETTLLIDIVTVPGRFEAVLNYIATRTAYLRQMFRTAKENHLHIVAVSDSVENLAYLIRMIQKACGEDIVELHCHAVKEVIKDVYGGIEYEQRTGSNAEGNSRDNG